MSDQIELHDSRVTIVSADGSLVFSLCPAYVHHWQRSGAGWSGQGRSQSAEIVIGHGSLAGPPPDGILEVAGGWVKVAGRLHQNLIPAPLEENGPVRGLLELVNAEPVEFFGQSAAVRLVGEPKYIEDLPAEWAPVE